MTKRKNERKSPGKRKVKNEVKITLWLLLVSAALLIVFSLWGNLIDPISRGLTGAVVGTQDEVNTTNNSSSEGNITLLPENNQTLINESNNGSNVGNTNNNSGTSNSSDLNNTSNESTVSNESNDSIGSTTSTTTIGGTGLGVLDESSSGGIGVAGGGIGISEDANSTACGYVNDDVTLTSNINTSVSCFVVNASNIIIDGAGFMVNGTLSSSAHGVNVTGFNNITIKNLNIQQFSISYFIARSQNSTIFNSSGINASDDNVQLLNVYGLNFTNNTINNATNQLIQLTSVNQSMFQNNRLVITDDIAMSFITSVSQNNNITGNNISFIGASAVTSAIQMGTTSTSNNIDVYNNTFHITRATAGIRGGYNGEVTNNTFYLGLKGDIQGNAYGIDPESNRDMLYLGNTILGFAERSNGIGSSAAGSNNTFRENFLNLSGALSQGMSFSTNCGSGNIYIQNYVKVNNTGGGTGRAFQYNCPSNTGSAILINNTFVNPLLAFQVALAATRGSSIVMLNNTYNQSNISFSGNLLPIDIQWWVVVNVTASNGTPLANANVTGFNLTRNKEQSLVTDASGLVKLNLTEKKQNQSFQSFLDTPHDINITLDGYLPNSTTVNLSATQSTQIDLVLAANDTTNPSVAINSPNSNQYYNANFIVNATVTDDGTLSTVQYRYENSTTNGSYAAMSQSGSYWNATFDLTSVSNGNYTFRINATDTSNNQNTTVTVIDVAIDTLNPQLSITLPVNNSNHSSSKMSIEGSASDPNPDRMVVNDTAFGSNLGSYTSWNFTNTTMVDGTFTILVTANDSAGNANSTSITFTVDTTTPNVQGFNTPLSRQNFTTGDVVVFNASISNGSGTAIHVVRFQITNGTGQRFNISTSATNATLFNASQVVNGVVDGNQTVIIFANDTAGNMNSSVNTTIVIDTTAPQTPTLNQPTNDSTQTSGTVRFNWTVVDTLTTTMFCNLTLNGAVNQTVIATANGTQTNVSISGLVNGTHSWNITCLDAVQLTNASVTQVFTVNTSTPAVEITLPANNSNLSTTKVSIEGTASAVNSDRIIINNSNFGNNLGSYTNWNFTNTTMVEGTFTLLVTANDTANNNQSKSITFTIDRTAPDVQGFNTPLSRQNFTTGDVVVFNTSISNGSGTAIHVVRFQLENGTNGLVNVTASATNATLYNFSITIGSGIDEGNRTVTIFTNDTSGNMNNSVSTTFVVDRTAPQTPTLNEPTAGSTQTASTIQFNWTSTDALSPTMYCNFTINGVVNQTNIETANGTRTNISLGSLADGSYSWNVTCSDAVRLSNASATQSFTIDTSTPSSPTTGGGGGGSSGGGAAAAAPSAPSSETATPTRSPERSTQTFATPTEVQQLLREQRFTISVVPTAVAEVAREERPTALQTALTGRAIGPPPERQVERRSLVNVRRVSVTFVNDGDKAIRIAPAVKDKSPIKLVDERRAEELVEERIRATLPTAPVQSPEERERIRTETEIVNKDIEVIENINNQLREIETITEVKEILRLTIDEEKTRSDEMERLDREIEEAKTVEEAKEKIKIMLELEKTKQQKLVQQIKTDEEIRREVEETVETLKKVEEERVQFISTTKALAPQKGLFFLPNVDGSVSYSGGHTTGKLLKTEIINPEETTVGPKQTVTKEFDVRLPISLTPKPVTLSFTTQGEEILTKEVDVTEKVRVGTALSIDIAQSIIDAYILIPKYDKNSAKFEKKYLLEFNINERQSFFFPSSRYSEIFGPYPIGQDTIFAQELSYDPEAYKGILPVSLKIYEDGELIAENDYTVDFGSGDVKEGFDLSLLTGFAVAGRAVFAGLNQNTQKYSTYLVDGLLLILLTFFLIVGTAYLHRIAVGVTPHKPIAGAVPRQKVTMMPKNIRSIFFEKELSHLNQRLSSLEGEEISALLWQDGQRMKQALERKEKWSPKVFPTILKQSERYQMLDKELLKVQNAIENVEKTEVQKTKIRTLLSSYRPTTAHPSERKTAIDKELEKITTTLARAERKPNSLLERLFPIINRKDEKETQKAMREVLRISRKVEGKNPRPSNELLEIEQRLGELNRISEKKVKLRRDIPPRSEMGKSSIKEMIQLQNEKSIIEKRLSGVGERNDINRINIFKTGIKPTKELSDIERRLANVDKESETVKGRVLINVPSVNVYERDNSVTQALREQRPRQKRELKRSAELEEIEKAILNVEKPFPLKTNVRTIIPDRREVKHTAAVEELKRLSEEYKNLDSVLKNDGQGTLRKRRITLPAPSPELLNVEKKIAEVDVMVPQKMKIKTELSEVLVGRELGGERKSTIDKELEEITRTLEQAEKRPSSLLERLFPKGKSASEKKKEREAVREVARISRKVEGKNRQPVNELIDVEKKLEKLKRELREKGE